MSTCCWKPPRIERREIATEGPRRQGQTSSGTRKVSLCRTLSEWIEFPRSPPRLAGINERPGDVETGIFLNVSLRPAADLESTNRHFCVRAIKLAKSDRRDGSTSLTAIPSISLVLKPTT